MILSRTLSVLVILTLVAACGTRDGEPRKLRNFRYNTQTPEEFAVLPNKPLQEPASYSELPPPNPGGPNRTDQTPIVDAVDALGGNPARLDDTGIPASDSVLVQQISRYGVTPGIRATLAEEDEAYRRRRGAINRFKIFRPNEYNDAYRRQTLDAEGEMRRWRRAGARIPSAPPEN